MRLRKDNLAIPKEFYIDSSKIVKEEITIANAESNMSFSKKVVKIPPLNLPRNSIEDWKQKLLIEKQKNEKAPSPTPSDAESFSESAESKLSEPAIRSVEGGNKKVNPNKVVKKLISQEDEEEGYDDEEYESEIGSENMNGS